MDPTEDWSGDCQPVTESPIHENEKQEVEQVIPGYSNFDDYVQESFNVIKAGIKAANSLPIDSDFRYYSCFPSFLNVKEQNVKMVLNVMQCILATTGIRSKMTNRDVGEKFDLLLEANDTLLDRANALMDEESGVVKNSEIELVVAHTNKQAVNSSWNNQISQPQQHIESTPAVRLLGAKNVQRPQLMFKDKIDNTSKPWYPKIKDKPNSLKPLAIFAEEGENGEVFSHPYEFELDMFSPPDDQLIKAEPRKYKSLEETPLIVIENSRDIRVLLEDLKQYKEIAVDVEHHSYRSFQGITCLMQISTGDTDYLIDSLTLRSDLHELNEIFTKPTILKVFHGADLDIQWLQRDLSLYIVNMFDTHQAAKQLNLPYLSLAYLLKQYCNLDPNKHFQLADWRIRPLPEELQKYAREDTHYLLYIKDVLRNALIDIANGQTNILKSVYDRSTDICKKTYIKPIWTEESCMSIYRKSQKMFNNKQLYALIELHKWRDATAREEDDSTGYVLPNHMLLNIAETLPREMQGILACCNPIPPLVRQNLLKLHKIVLKAREQPLIKPVLEDIKQRLSQRNQMTNSEAWIYSPHDIPSGMEARADLPCLLDNHNPAETIFSHTSVKHTVTVFDSPVTSEDEETSRNDRDAVRKKKFIFVSPFERYKRVIPMVAEEEAREREKQKQEEDSRLDKSQNIDIEIVESKNRVYEHFKQISEVAKQQTITTPPAKKESQIPLNQIQGCKRKRDSNINKESAIKKEKTNDKLLTPAPSLETEVVQCMQKERDETERLTKEDNMQKSIARIQEQVPDNTTVNLLRSRKKGERKNIIKDLNKQNMLPSKQFDYKSVDFSSFQGGSKNIPGQEKQVNFEQKVKREKRRRRKKQKLNI